MPYLAACLFSAVGVMVLLLLLLLLLAGGVRLWGDVVKWGSSFHVRDPRGLL